MKKTQIWELIEIKELIGSTDTTKQNYGFELLCDFIEKECFKIG